MNKELIKKRFSKKLDSYNKNAIVQKRMAERMISMIDFENINSFSDASVLELGCGTGFLTALVANRIQFKNYVAIDIVPECEAYIKNINARITFVPSDIESYMNNSEEKYDLIISNAVFQWLENLPDILNNLAKRLKPNGQFVFTTFGTRNFKEIKTVLGKTLHYLPKQELAEMLVHFDTVIEEDVKIITFDSPKDILRHIQSTGVNALSKEVWTKGDLKIFEKKYNDVCKNNPILTYNPIYVVLKQKII